MKKTILLLVLSVILILSACGEDETDGGIIYSFTDSLGRAVDVSSFEKTAVISGSLAEVWQLAGGELYGITNDAYEHSLELAEDIKNYGDVKNPSVENMIADGVDLVILSGGIANHIKLEEVFESAGITAAYFDLEHFEDYLSMLKICTEITGREDLYETNGSEVQKRVEAVLARSETRENTTVLLLRAFSTGVKAKGSDNMTGRMLSELGCTNIADSETSLLEDLSLEAIVRADPDFIFITTMGDEDAAIAQYKAELASNPAWNGMSAVKAGNVHILPKDMFHYKPNERWDEAYGYLEDILYD